MIPAGTKPASQVSGSATGTYTFEICFKKVSTEDGGAYVCANQFTMDICKYSPYTWPPTIHHNIYKGLTIDLDGFLDDTVGSGFVGTCFDPLDTDSQLIFEETTAPIGYSVLNHA